MKYKLNTHRVINSFISEDLYFGLAENTDEISTVKNLRKRYVINFIIIIINHFCAALLPGADEIAFNSSTLSI